MRQGTAIILLLFYLGITTAVSAQSQRPTRPVQRQARRDTSTTRPPTQPRLIQRPTANRAVAPEGFPLSAAKQKRVDAILRYWEHHTSKIKTYDCKFTRQNFDFVFGEKDRPLTVDKGTVRYASPDKGLMRVDAVYRYDANETDKNQQYKKQDVQFGEYWVCDGESIFKFDARTKVLTETQLPEAMQGTSIGEGPLPFLFGAKADRMKQRYWIREIEPPADVKDQYWLEAIPRKQEDAANFERLLVQLQKPSERAEQLVPKAMKLYNKQGHIIYHFSEHKANDARHRVADFFRSFVRPRTPRGWTKVVEDWAGERVDNATADSNNSGGGSAKR